MCLGIPGKVVEINENSAKVDVAGTRRDASLMLIDDVNLGDYVIVHAGFAIQKVNEAKAQETLRLINEIIDGMQK